MKLGSQYPLGSDVVLTLSEPEETLPMTAGTVTVSGTAMVGSTLTANEGTWSPVLSGTDYSYKWGRGASTEISGATSKTYRWPLTSVRHSRFE